MIKIDSAQFEMLAEPPIPEWVMRVKVQGSGFTERAVALAAEVGELTVEGMFMDPEGTGFTGYLTTEPEEGAELRVGRHGLGFIDTGITYQRLVA
jgi:hypothetical protein